MHGRDNLEALMPAGRKSGINGGFMAMGMDNINVIRRHQSRELPDDT